MPIMLILRGIASDEHPGGQLDEPSALEYAARRGYHGLILKVPGRTGPRSRQVLMALDRIQHNPNITALYGFSGGGYNVLHILEDLTEAERERIKLVVVLGAPENPETLYRGPWELQYRIDPPGGHMAGPSALLAELDTAA